MAGRISDRVRGPVDHAEYGKHLRRPAVLERNRATPPIRRALGRIARKEIEDRAAALHIPKFAVGAALKLKSSDGLSYGDRLAQVRTERELSGLYDDLIERVPLGQRLFASAARCRPAAR